MPSAQDPFYIVKEEIQDSMRRTVRKAATHFPTAIVTGRCRDKKWSDLANEVRLGLKEYPKLQLTQGRKVLEIRPIIKWDKGKALEFLLKSLGFADCNNVFPIYIGDDRSDEDAFKVLRDRGQGFGIVVTRVPKQTLASYHLREPSEVMDFLQRLVRWKRLSLGRRFQAAESITN